MAVAIHRTHPTSLHPLHAALLAATTSLFLAALLSDIAYATSYEVQWKNFASWLLVGGLALGGVTLLFALFELIRRGRRGWRQAVYIGLLLSAWLLAFINVLVHAEDAWGSMPEALVLSAVVAAFAISAMAIAFFIVGAAELQ